MSQPLLIPEGFVQGNFTPFSTHIGPLYYRREDKPDGGCIGWVGMPFQDQHVGGNNRGHGGVLLTLLDEALGMNAAIHTGKDVPVVTLSLQTSFIAATTPGHFLMATGTVTHASNSVAFVEGKAWCGDTLVGTANGVWKYLKPPK